MAVAVLATLVMGSVAQSRKTTAIPPDTLEKQSCTNHGDRLQISSQVFYLSDSLLGRLQSDTNRAKTIWRCAPVPAKSDRVLGLFKKVERQRIVQPGRSASSRCTNSSPPAAWRKSGWPRTTRANIWPCAGCSPSCAAILPAKKRFTNGCEVLEKCQGHGCVIGYLEHGKTDGAHYCVMEYVEGANLKVLYARHDPVLLDNVAQIIIDMAEALEHVHESGYIHLDFKPENVIVSATPPCGWWTSTWLSRFPKKPPQDHQESRHTDLHGPGTTPPDSRLISAWMSSPLA